METLDYWGGGPLYQVRLVPWERAHHGLPPRHCLFSLLAFLMQHQALTKCQNHYPFKIHHKLGWPCLPCLLILSGGCQSQLEGSKGLVLSHFQTSVEPLTVSWNHGRSPYQHPGWLALLGISFPGLSRCLGLHLE